MANKQQDNVLQAAADWWVRLREPGDGEAIEQWLAWTAEDARHLQTFERVSELAERLGGLDSLSRQGLIRAFARPIPAPRRWLRMAVAASIAAVVVSGAAYVGWMHVTAGVTTTRLYQSGLAQNRNFTLPDGTKVALGAASMLSVSYGEHRRRVDVRGGEAYFEVVHDDRRPFVVTAGDVTVRDIGTAFDVRRTGERVMVAVTQGRVAIVGGHGRASPRHALEASAGQRVSYDPAAAGMVVHTMAPAQATAWRHNRLEFIDEPLAVVIANLNRYASKPLHVADADLDRLSYTGTIRTDAIDSWIDALPEIFPLQVHMQGGQVVLSDARHVVR